MPILYITAAVVDTVREVSRLSAGGRHLPRLGAPSKKPQAAATPAQRRFHLGERVFVFWVAFVQRLVNGLGRAVGIKPTARSRAAERAQILGDHPHEGEPGVFKQW